MSHSVVARVEAMAHRIAGDLGLEVVDIQFVKSGGRQILRVLIDKPGGVAIDDCEHFSEPFSRALDEADPIPEQYYLEVSSPGLDRPIKTEQDFRRFTGSLVDVALSQPVEGRRKVHATLVGLEGETIVLGSPEKEWRIPRSMVRSVRLSPDDDLGGGGTRR